MLIFRKTEKIENLKELQKILEESFIIYYINNITDYKNFIKNFMKLLNSLENNEIYKSNKNKFKYDILIFGIDNYLVKEEIENIRKFLKNVNKKHKNFKILILSNKLNDNFINLIEQNNKDDNFEKEKTKK